MENEGRHIQNAGGVLWVLGLKTERGGTILETSMGGKSEVLGAFMYTTTGPGGKNEDPMFVIRDSSLVLFGGEANFGAPGYKVRYRETRGTETKETVGGMGTLYVGCGKEAPRETPQKRP